MVRLINFCIMPWLINVLFFDGTCVTLLAYLKRLLTFSISATGPVPSPFDCYMVNRGLKTLHVRMKEHMKNGLAVAHFLEASPRVERVIHPGQYQTKYLVGGAWWPGG